MGRPQKQEYEKVIRRTFSLYPAAWEEFENFKKEIEFEISDSALISYLIKQGIKRINENPKQSGKDAGELL